MSALSNLQLWNYIRNTNPNFKNLTSKGTADLFTEKGYEALQRNNLTALNDFFNLSMRVAFQRINVADAKNPLGDVGLVQRYDTPNGGYVQRMSIASLKPTTPLYRNLANGASVDPWKVRKPEAEERFFQQNFDYQSFVTLQDYQLKTIFISEFGVSDFVAGVMKSLANGYVKQSYVNTLEVLNAGLTSAAYPLQDSQNVKLSSWTDAAPTTAELTDLILNLKDIATLIETSASTNALNAAGFDTSYNVDDFVILCRAGIKNRIALGVTLGAFNPETLSIPFDMKEVQNFGGLKPYVLDDTTHVYVQPIYDSNGEQVAYVDASVTVNGAAHMVNGKWVVNITSGGTTADTNQTVVESELDGWDDPNEDVIAVIAQKGLIFENIQNPYSVIPSPYNGAGLYTTYWASSPNNAICYDYLYGCIVVRKPTA